MVDKTLYPLAHGFDKFLCWIYPGFGTFTEQELAATQGRWALILFGSNDAQNENERVYLKRLVYLERQQGRVNINYSVFKAYRISVSLCSLVKISVLKKKRVAFNTNPLRSTLMNSN